MTRSVLAIGVLFGGLASAQPVTYFPPIAARTPTPLAGTGAVDVTLWLSDPGVDVGESILFATTTQGTTTPFSLGTLSGAAVTNLPAPIQGIATAPGVLVQGNHRTLIAVASSGQVLVGTIESGAFVSRGPNQAVSGGPPLALAASSDGGAVLLVSDGTATQFTRWELGLPGVTADAVRGLTAAALTEPARSLLLDGIRNQVLVGGNTLGNLYRLDARLDAGPTLIESALLSQGRLAPPVTGLALYQGALAAYLLVTSPQGLTVYDLLQADPLPGAFRVIPQDDAGQLSGPTGVAVTNLPAGAAFPRGVIALGDATNRGLALVRWDVLALDAGLVIDTTTDPRGLSSDAGPDAGSPDGGSSGGSPGGGAPSGPFVPVPDDTSSCTSAPGGAAALAALVALLALVAPRRRQRR